VLDVVAQGVDDDRLRQRSSAVLSISRVSTALEPFSRTTGRTRARQRQVPAGPCRDRTEQRGSCQRDGCDARRPCRTRCVVRRDRRTSDTVLHSLQLGTCSTTRSENMLGGVSVRFSVRRRIPRTCSGAWLLKPPRRSRRASVVQMKPASPRQPAECRPRALDRLAAGAPAWRETGSDPLREREIRWRQTIAVNR